jgi:hypothetical protein
MVPKARQDQLLIEDVANELVVYDLERHRAHLLNRTAALVWRHCDGQKSVAELASLLQTELNPVADEDLVWLALDQLGAAQLLQEPMRRSPEQRRTSRRHVVRKVGMIGVLSLLLPAVSSLSAPARAEVVSCNTGSGSS